MPAIHPSRSTTSISRCDKPAIEYRAGLTFRQFLDEYQIPRRPVVLTDATTAWEARQWSPEVLRERIGHRRVTIRTQEGPQEFHFDELTDRILSSSPDDPAPYARNIDIHRELPELAADISPRVEFATPDWKSSRLLGRDFLFPDGLEELFYGGAGASFPVLHVDYFGMDGFVNQLYGEKEFVLFPPDQSPFLYPTEEDELFSALTDLENPDLEKFPLFAHAEPVIFTLQPGDTLYMPNGWWHTTRMLSPSITVITATWNRSNWWDLIRQYRYRGRTTGFRKAAMLARLTAAGLIHRTRELLSGR